MNIFFLCAIAKAAAWQLCDKHIVKLCTEAAQMLCTAFRLLGDEKLANKLNFYRKTHVNHPMSVWVRSSKENFAWALEHGLEICAAYTATYGRRHKTQDVLERLQNNWEVLKFPQIKFTTPPQCMPEKYRSPGRCVGNVVAAYRRYYLGEKQSFAKWKSRTAPSWFLQCL